MVFQFVRPSLMFDQPLKLMLTGAAIAAIAGVYLSHQAPAEVPSASASPGLLASLFGGPAPSAPMAAVPVAAPPSALGFGRIELPPDRGGQYHADVEIEGRTVPMLVDTGATLVSLTAADAARLGLSPAPADYTANVLTANGQAKAAPVTLREVRVGNLLVRNVAALVLPQGINGTSLLGMSFLQRLGGFEIASGNLVLRP